MLAEAQVDFMAKKRATKSVKADDPERKPMVVQIRGSQEYKEWAEGLAGFDGSTVAALYDRAARAYAKAIGYDKQPPKR